MVRRVVIEEECPIHGEYGPHRSLPMCQMSQRRVLDPGSYLLIEKADGKWPEWATEHCALWLNPLCNDPRDFLDDFVGEQP